MVDAEARAPRRVLITSALPYINGVKHLGNLVGSMLPADAYARYMRARGVETLFICATDEHGTPAELAAAKADKPVAEFCAEMHAVQKQLGEGFRLSFDWFGRSSSARNHALTQHFAGRLADAGLIAEVVERQVYSHDDGRFLPDRYIEGVCPNCGYDRARGDQCENCTKQLNPTDLIRPRSAVSGGTHLETRDTKHLHLRQSRMRERLRAWIDAKTDWPPLTTSIARKWLDDGDGLQDRSITRDLDWGVPVKRGDVDWPGLEGKVFYVWFDAPIEYIAATAEWADAGGGADADVEARWRRWWREDGGAADVRYVEFMAKDNIPFHTLSFPVTLMGSGEPWKLVDYIKGFNWLTYDGGKFSTSQRRGVFMDQALELLPSDYWRWWLLSNAPESADSDFTWSAFQSGVNKDLADVLGNFVSRVTKFCRAKFSDQAPEGGTPGPLEQRLEATVAARLAAYQAAMEAMEIRRAAQELRALWAAGNEYMQEAAPWATIKTDRDQAAMQTRIGLNLIRCYAIVSRPFIPDASDTLLESLGLAADAPWPEDARAALGALPPGAAFTTPGNLFTKIDDAQVAAWTERFGGGCAAVDPLDGVPA